MKKKILIYLLLIFSLFLFSCKNNEVIEPDNPPKREDKYEVNTDFSYLYDSTGFEFDVSPYIVNENEIILPDLSNYSRGEIKYILDKLGVLYSFEFSHSIIRSEEDLNKFVSYSEPYKAGDTIKKDKFVYVYTTELALTHNVHDLLKMDLDYEYSNFVYNGLGEVSLIRCIDGDTAWFKDKVTGDEIKLRFLCINTTESTIEHDPWGKAASNFTKNILTNAKTIVLESEEYNRKDVYGRYLGYVWVDGVLLNLMLVDEAYTNASCADSKYKEYFTEAMLHAQLTGRRFYGEIDPDYDYEIGDFK